MKNYLNKYVNRINPYQPGRPIEEVARELNLDLNNIAKLASNECPLGPSPKAVKAMKKYANEMHLYPDGGAYYLRKKISEKYNLPPSNFIFGNGSNEILEFIGHCLIQEGMSVVASKHSFIVYKLITNMFGGEFIETDMTEDLTHDLDAMLDAIREDTRIVFICNPNNPTGSMVDNEELYNFIEKVPDDILIVFDEAYAEIAMEEMPITLKYVVTKNNVIILRTFSKAYGLAGLRIGYGIANPEIIEFLNKPRQPFNVNRMAQKAAIAALDDDDFVGDCSVVYRNGANQFINFCIENRLEFIDPTANFILIKVGDGLDVFEKLQNQSVIVRPMMPYQLPEWIRISFGTNEENQKFIDEFQKIIDK